MKRLNQFLALAAMLWVVALPVRADELLSSAQSLINQDRPQEALALLQPAEATRAGEVRFDYLLALATLDAGDAGKALLIFERILAQQPEFHGARLDFARALYLTGRYAEAEAEFTAVAASGPPPAAQRAVDDYLARIERHKRRLRFSRFLSARMRGGYDTNVNSATDLGEFLGFALSSASREQDSDFLEFGVAAGGAWRPRQGLVMDGRLAYTTRHNGQASFADTDVLLGSVGLRSESARQRRGIALQGFDLDLDDEENNSAVTLAGSWQWRVGDNWWLGGALRYGWIRYSDELEIKDVDQFILAATASRPVGELQRGLVRVRIGYGEDDPATSGSRYARDFLVADIGLDWRFNSALSASLSASVEDSDFDAVFFEQRYSDSRSDTTWRGRGLLDWRFAPKWRFVHTLSYTLNDTEVEIFEYERFEFGLGLSYVWQ